MKILNCNAVLIEFMSMIIVLSKHDCDIFRGVTFINEIMSNPLKEDFSRQ